MLRRTIAERMSPIKKRLAIETPILQELPVPAERVQQVMWAQERLPVAVPEIRVGIPVFVHGKAYGKTAGLWYRVTFPRPVTDPSVVCVGEARRGEVPRPPPLERIAALDLLEKIEALTVVEKIEALVKVAKEKIPDLTIPKWEMHIPTASDFVDLVKKFFGDWGILNWARDAIAWAIGNFEYSIWNALFRPRALERLNNEVLIPLRDRINDRLERVRTQINAKLDEIDARLETLRTSINDRLGAIDDRFDTLRTGVNDRLGGIDDRLDTLRTRANDRLADLFPRLYAAWGFPSNMALTPLHIRNVTSTGFEFQSYGETTCYYIAIGTRG